MITEQTLPTMTEAQAQLNLEFADYLEFEVKDEEFEMSDYGKRTPCGTVACIAGWRVLWTTQPLPHAWSGDFLIGEVPLSLGGREFAHPSPGTLAQQAMGLNDSERQYLFHGGHETKEEAAATLREIVYKHYPHLRQELLCAATNPESTPPTTTDG